MVAACRRRPRTSYGTLLAVSTMRRRRRTDPHGCTLTVHPCFEKRESMLASSRGRLQGKFCRISATQLKIRVGQSRRVNDMSKPQRIVFSAALAFTFIGRLRHQPRDRRSRARARIGRSRDRHRRAAIRAVAADARRRVRARSGAHDLRRRCRAKARGRQRSPTAVRVRRAEQLGAECVGAAGRQDRRQSRLADGAQLGSRARRRAGTRDRARGRASWRSRDATRSVAARRAARDASRGATQ